MARIQSAIGNRHNGRSAIAIRKFHLTFLLVQHRLLCVAESSAEETQMEITREEAEAALAEAHEVLRRTRRTMFTLGGSGLLVWWGLVWIGAFVACHFAPMQAWRHWL